MQCKCISSKCSKNSFRSTLLSHITMVSFLWILDRQGKIAFVQSLILLWLIHRQPFTSRCKCFSQYMLVHKKDGGLFASVIMVCIAWSDHGSALQETYKKGSTDPICCVGKRSLDASLCPGKPMALRLTPLCVPVQELNRSLTGLIWSNWAAGEPLKTCLCGDAIRQAAAGTSQTRQALCRLPHRPLLGSCRATLGSSTHPHRHLALQGRTHSLGEDGEAAEGITAQSRTGFLFPIRGNIWESGPW